ncbi:hypothetical protein GR702_14045 [Novosphingobium sp. FGD1]|uniref:Uncharacterized protein n=1 Tax=Novosphingobium silvae TaxID=2692619 RepID=A0A7X4GIH6_9SPHN|nr:hypothetical protein [Novosphingobium silvae]MYL98884.1 hypothetical protein [Novosphingobium silvae]
MGAYIGWVSLFGWLAWQRKGRVLLGAGAIMLIAFGWVYRAVTNEMAAADYHHSSDMAAGLVIYFAAGVLLLPVVVSAVIYPFARFLRH